MELNHAIISAWFKDLQDSICNSLEEIDGKEKFTNDGWSREQGGGGRSRVIQNGNIIEKGGVNFSAVWGELPEKTKIDLNVTGSYFYATGLSIVIHPVNPFVPIIHMNVRYFEVSDNSFTSKEFQTFDNNHHTSNLCWFGGGIDLTPHYIDTEDAVFFHQYLKDICDKHVSSFYCDFKKIADDYFYLKHRNETRGIGGIFFDQLRPNNKLSKLDLFEFVKSVGSAFIPIYSNLISKNKDLTYSEQNKQWQLLRRGRYVEYNLIYDKGTKFGLETNGRIESILMSLPPLASWIYDFKLEPDSIEENTLHYLRKGINWV